MAEVRSGPRNLDSGLSEISIVFQAAVPKLVASKYTTSGVRRPQVGVRRMGCGDVCVLNERGRTTLRRSSALFTPS